MLFAGEAMGECIGDDALRLTGESLPLFTPCKLTEYLVELVEEL
jgi:hypothetical protein